MKIANTEYNTAGAYKLLLNSLRQKPLETINSGSRSGSYVFFNKNKEIAMLFISEQMFQKGYAATISVCTIRKSATEGYFVKELGKMNLRSSTKDKDVLSIINLELDYLYRGNHYATRMVSVARELAQKQGYKYILAYAPKDPIISFKTCKGKFDEENAQDRTELFFNSCGFKTMGTYKTKQGDQTRVYGRAINKLQSGNKIENESKAISSVIANKLERYQSETIADAN